MQTAQMAQENSPEPSTNPFSEARFLAILEAFKRRLVGAERPSLKYELCHLSMEKTVPVRGGCGMHQKRILEFSHRSEVAVPVWAQNASPKPYNSGLIRKVFLCSFHRSTSKAPSVEAFCQYKLHKWRRKICLTLRLTPFQRPVFRPFWRPSKGVSRPGKAFPEIRAVSFEYGGERLFVLMTEIT